MRDIAVVTWNDPISQDEWHDIKDASKEPATIKSVGYVIMETDTQLTIALNLDEENDACSQTLIIPKCLIKKIVYIKE